MKINPYIAGNPVGGGDAFIGRADVLREVVRVLRSPSENALVLYGQRRIGKTSVLQELVTRLPNEGLYRPAYFDLQDKAARPLAEVLAELAARAAKELDLPPPQSWGEATPHTFREEFIPNTLAHLPLETSLVLLFDEFDVLDNPGEVQAGATFFPYLRELLSLDPRLQFIFVIGRRPEDLSSLTLSVFKGVKSRSVSLMSPEETANLVRLAERNGTLRWFDEAVTHVYALTGGHPFLTQQLCEEIWYRAYENESEELPTIQPDQVEAAVPAALDKANNALEWLWDGLKPAQRIVASALAETGPEAISQDELNQRLLDSGVRILIGELQDAPHVLQEWDLIAPVEAGYRFRVELLRRWIAERKPLARVQEEIDRIQPVADNLFQAAYNLYQGGQLEQATPLLRQAIGFNPNHLRANQLLAEILLAQSELIEARQLLESLYQYQPAAARPRLVQVLLLQARKAEDEEEQLHLYERVLQLEPGQPEAKDGSRPILQQKLIQLEQTGEYQAALELARQLHKNYPEEQDKLPDLGLLERKTRLDDLYQRALGALQAGDRPIAQKLLAEVVQLEPSYRQATRYLHLAVTGVDAPGEARLKGEEDALRLRQTTLSLKNPLDYLRLLWWLFVVPQRLKSYQEQYGIKAVYQLGGWLVSTLIWLPLFLLTLLSGTSLIFATYTTISEFSAITYFWLFGFLILTWLLTGWSGNWVSEKAGKVISTMIPTLGGGVAFLDVLLLSSEIGESQIFLFSALIVVLICIALGVAFNLANSVVRNLALLVLFGVVVGMAFFVTFPIVRLIIDIPETSGWLFTLGVSNDLGPLLSIGGGAVATTFVIVIIAFFVWLIVPCTIGGGMADVLRNSLEKGRPSWWARALFALLILAHAFIILVSFLAIWNRMI